MPITKEEAQRIFEQVKANSKTLEGCAGPHDFSKEHEKYAHGLVRSWACRKCGGTVDNIAKLWYERGLKDGAKSDPGRVT